MFESVIEGSLTWQNALLCTGVSLLLGAFIAFIYCFKSSFSKNFMVTLIVMPAIVQAVIMMVNGNVGAGVAVMGAFSLVRFRSAPGNSKDIAFIFFAMAAGIASGMGQLVFAAIITIAVGAVFFALKFLPFAKDRFSKSEKLLRVTIPETLDFALDIEPIIKKHTTYYEVLKVKTSNMGSLFTVDYKIILKADASQKQLIDDIRVANSNLPIVLSSFILSEELL